MDAVAESGRNYASTKFSLSVENERADAERNGQTCLARSHSQARTGTSKSNFRRSADRAALAAIPG